MAIGNETGPQGIDAAGAPDTAAGPGAPPPGGGPVLAALARRQQGPQVSAPGPGDQGSAMMQIQNALGMMKQALNSLDVTSPIHRDLLRAMQSLSRHLAQGQPTAGVQKTQAQDMVRAIAQNALLANIMNQQRQGQEQGQGGPPGAMAQAPMPSTPLPGA
jgi:hypothetical protein